MSGIRVRADPTESKSFPRQRTSASWRLAGCVPALLFFACQPALQPSDPEGRGEAMLTGQAGAVEGIARLAGGAPPVPSRVRNTTDPEVCGSIHTVDDLRVSPANGGIEGVIVALADVPAERIPPPAPQRLVLDNVDCRFAPRVSVLTVGSSIEATNSDPVLHTTHLYGAVEANLALPFQESRVSRIVDRAGMIIVKCDVHGWMQAFIRVDNHPFHAVSDSAGRFRIADVPPGSYVLEAWHEKLGSWRKDIRIGDGATESVEIGYRLDSR